MHTQHVDEQTTLPALCAHDVTRAHAQHNNNSEHDGDENDDVQSRSSYTSFVSVSSSSSALLFEQRMAQLSQDVGTLQLTHDAPQQQQQQQPQPRVAAQQTSPSHSRTSSLSSSSSLSLVSSSNSIHHHHHREDDDDDDDDVYLSALLRDITRPGACTQTRFCAYPSADALKSHTDATARARDTSSSNTHTHTHTHTIDDEDKDNYDDDDGDAAAMTKLFVGGLRFELIQLGRRAVAWLLAEACGVQLPIRHILIHRKARRGRGTTVSPTGCASVFVRRRDDVDALLCMHQRIYCASDGLYVAASAADLRATMALHGFACRTCQERGPTHPVVIERAHHTETVMTAAAAAATTTTAASTAIAAHDGSVAVSCARHTRRRGCGARHRCHLSSSASPVAWQQMQHMHGGNVSRSSSHGHMTPVNMTTGELYSNSSSSATSYNSGSGSGSSAHASPCRADGDVLYSYATTATTTAAAPSMMTTTPASPLGAVCVYTPPPASQMAAIVQQLQQQQQQERGSAAASTSPSCTLFVGGLPSCASPLWIVWLFALLGAVSLSPQHVALLPSPPAFAPAGMATSSSSPPSPLCCCCAVVQLDSSDAEAVLRHRGCVACAATRVCVAVHADALTQWLCAAAATATACDMSMTVLHMERRLTTAAPPPPYVTTRLLHAMPPPPPPPPSSSSPPWPLPAR